MILMIWAVRGSLVPIVFRKINLQKTLFSPFPTSFYMKMAFLIRGSPSSFLIGQFPLPLSSVEIFLRRDWSVFSARGVVSNKYEDWFSSNPAFALRPKSKQPKLFSRYQTYHTQKKTIPHNQNQRLVDLSDWRNQLEEKKSHNGKRKSPKFGEIMKKIRKNFINFTKWSIFWEKNGLFGQFSRGISIFEIFKMCFMGHECVWIFTNGMIRESKRFNFEVICIDYPKTSDLI